MEKEDAGAVANLTNGSYITIPSSQSMNEIWASGQVYSFTMWVNFKHSYGRCSGTYPCSDLFQTSEGCTEGAQQDPYNSTYFLVNWLEWNGPTAYQCSNTAAESSPNVYIPYNQWHFVAMVVVYKASGGWFETCLDKICYNATWSSSTGPGYYSNPSTYIGTDNQINGKLANMQAYNIALTQSQIDELYYEGVGGLPVSPQHLIGWWPLDGNVNDYSGNGNNGVPTNVQWVSP